MRRSGPMRTAIMSFDTMLAMAHAGVVTLGDDVGQAVIHGDLDLDVGIIGQKFGQLGPKDRFGPHVPPWSGGWCRRACPEVRLKDARLRPRFLRTSGPMDCISRSPAWVGETLRVERFKIGCQGALPSPRMVWLRADWETPSWAAALVKLRWRATARKATGH